MTDSVSDVIRTYLPELRAFARLVCRIAQQEDDLLQATLIKIATAWPTYDPSRGEPLPWLRTIMRNQAKDMWRRLTTHSRNLQTVVEDLRETVAYIDDEALDQARKERALHGFIQQLPKEQQEVLRMHFFEDLSDSETARALGIKLGTVKSRKRLGLQKLRELFNLS